VGNVLHGNDTRRDMLPYSKTFLYTFIKKMTLCIYRHEILTGWFITRRWKDTFDITSALILNTIQSSEQYKKIRQLNRQYKHISFLLSGNNTVLNVQRVYRRLSEKYGKCIYKDTEENRSFSSFPDYEVLKNLSKEDFEACKSGYRGAYIVHALQVLDKETIENLDMHSYEEATAILMQVHGIGPKIADCVLLYSYKFQNIYPTDTWVKRFTKEIYFQNRTVSEERIRNFGMSYFKPYAGWAQLFLYTLFREKHHHGIHTFIDTPAYLD
jgi:N-glycosylase/DNA lyase